MPPRHTLERDEEHALASKVRELESKLFIQLSTHPDAKTFISKLLCSLEEGTLAPWDVIVDGGSPSDTYVAREARARAIGLLRSASDNRLTHGACPALRLRPPLLREFTRRITRRAPKEQSEHFWSVWADIDGTRTRLIEANIGLVRHVVSQHRDTGILDDTDLMQEGAIGLLRAAEKFDPERGIRFATYAVFWVRQAIQRAIAARSQTIRVPLWLSREASRVRHAAHTFTNEAGRTASPEWLVARTGVTPATLKQISRLPSEPVSLQSPTGLCQDGMLSDVLLGPPTMSQADEVFAGELRHELGQLVDGLPVRQAWIVSEHFGLGDRTPRSLAALGKEIGVSRERIRQIKKAALDALRAKHLQTLMALR